MNILLSDFDYAPFTSIKNSDYLPSVLESIEVLKNEIKIICDEKINASFENTIEKLDYSGMKLDRITSIFFNLNSANTNNEIQNIAQKIAPLLSEIKNDILLNKNLFDKINKVNKRSQELKLSKEQTKLLKNTYNSFLRNGANLNKKDKSTLRKIDIQLSKLSLKFGQNLLNETNDYELHITNESDLIGLKKDHIEAASILALEKNKKGWLFNLDYPSFSAFIKYSEKRLLRKEMIIAYSSRGFNNNKNDNQKIVLDIVNLRHKRANILGYNSHSEYILEDRMAKSTTTVINFLNDMISKVNPKAIKEFKELENYAMKKDNIDSIQKWDIAYYSQKLKEDKFSINEDKLKAYFSLENVMKGVFMVSTKLYEITFEEVNDIDKYHNEVKTYKVQDKFKNILAILYTDFYPRNGKRNGAWMTSYKSQYKFKGKNIRPHISIVCNFTKPTKTSPSLLTFSEVTTLFHEFGHALHGILANTTYKSLSGTNVSWDFVELPSQILENWCYESEVLELFAYHYKTKKLIPIDLINKIKKIYNFQQGMQTLRQLSYGLLDMNWHSINPSKITNVKEYELQTLKKLSLSPTINETCVTTSFAHIFQGGYSSAYYSYKWAEVLDADAFKYFKENGIFNKEIALKFKENILSKGGTDDPMNLYVKFRGKKPSLKPLMERSGII